MRTFLMGMMTLIVSGCATAVTDRAVVDALAEPVTAHAAALAGDDVAAMRRTGRNLIAIYDAAAGH